jgi:hypothetical protein
MNSAGDFDTMCIIEFKIPKEQIHKIIAGHKKKRAQNTRAYHKRKLRKTAEECCDQVMEVPIKHYISSPELTKDLTNVARRVRTALSDKSESE